MIEPGKPDEVSVAMTDLMDDDSTGVLRENGKLLYYHSDGDKDSIDSGIAMLQKAASMGDAEALYIIGAEMLKGRIRPHSGDRFEYAYACLQSASRSGSVQAKGLLNRLCMNRYSETLHYETAEPQPLTDFEGKKIRVDRKGIFVPVDARLSFDGITNTLTLTSNIHFVFFGNEEFDKDTYVESVLRGFRDWEGEYEVFGGQKVRIILELTTESRLKDSVHVLPLVDETRQTVLEFVERIGKGKKVRQAENVIAHRRSFAGVGLGKWSARSTKIIWMQSSDGRFDNPNELRNTARHEFGHILGLGDLYASETDGLEGVAAGQYEELSCFHLYGRQYHLVMCDPEAPVSNNDIEMVLLAFSSNRFQRFQSDSSGRELSEALGKGN